MSIKWSEWRAAVEWTVHYHESKWLLFHETCDGPDPRDAVVLPGNEVLKCSECGTLVPDGVIDMVRNELECQ
jgi:hypothetical protein